MIRKLKIPLAQMQFPDHTSSDDQMVGVVTASVKTKREAWGE